MLKQSTLIAVAACSLLAPSMTASERLDEALQITEEPVTLNNPPSPVPAAPVAETPEYSVTCENCSKEEKLVLNALQDQGITDRHALAVIMGNIRQESKFDSIICEGGRRTGYHGCHRGGFGLIQFTSLHRYNGLGTFAKGNQMNPDHIETQIQYVFTEREWRAAEKGFKRPGQSVSYYMNHAYTWLGWGIHGNRTHYSNQYLRLLQPS